MLPQTTGLAETKARRSDRDNESRSWLIEFRRLNCNGVTMVQSTESRERVDCTLSPKSDRCWPTGWRVRKSEVGPIFMVVAHILGHQPLEVLLIQDDHVVQ